MAQYTERLWTQTKDTEQLTFIAGVDLPYRELVKESGPNTNIMVVATTVDAIGYVLSPKGVLAGEKVDVQMLYGRPGGGGGSGVQSVTGLDTDNTDPLNPIVNIAVDGITITGQGTPGDPLVAVTGGGGTVTSVTGVGPNVFITGTLTDPIVNAGTQAWEWSGFITTPQLSNYQNNYTQAGFANISTLKVIGDPFDPAIMTGFAGGTEGRFLIVHNASLDTPIYFVNQDAGSAAANQILMTGLPGEFYDLPIGGTVLLRYDADVQKWRLLGNYVYTLIDDGNGVVTVGGTLSQKLISFNGVFTDGVTITGNGTAGSPLTGSPPIDVRENNTYFVDPNYGNDATAVVNSRVNKYQNIDTALALAISISNSKVYLMPGNHVINNLVSVTDVLNIEMSPGSTLILNTGAPSFNISPGQKLYITGEGQIQFVSMLFINSSPSSNVLPEVIIRAKSLDGSGSTNIGDITSMLFSIECDSINDLRLEGGGYSKGHVATDFWQSSSGGMLRLSDFTLFNGETKYQENGPQTITVKGRTREKCKFFAGQSLFSGVWTENGVESYKTKINLHIDGDTTDCIGFFDIGRGNIRHWGDWIHRKTNLAGNEMPLFYQTQDIASDSVKPTFEHVEGNYVAGTNNLFSGSQNNEFFSVQKLCNVILNGRYQNSGENTGLGAWPILLMDNNNAFAGESVVTLNGEFKNLFKDISPIKYNGSGNPAHTFKIVCKQTTIETNKDGETIYSGVPIPIYVYHTLTMNTNYNPNIFDGLSTPRTIVDGNVTVDVPEYGS